MIFLETKRLLLRNICPEDAAIMFDYRNNEICARYQRGQTKDLPGIKALTERRRHDTLTTTDNAMVAVALKETNEMVGEIVVMPNDDCFSLGYTFHYAHHRNGYAFEALSCLIEYLHALQPDWEFSQGTLLFYIMHWDYLRYWSRRPQDRVFGQPPGAFYISVPFLRHSWGKPPRILHT